ncbi:hypothetical protein, partial [Chromobacterium amazonense]|uniref:hypothetical protein n=1 Tax=Chromobacterium amazonense TaxID=1382803 RepID=UPI0021B70BAF
WHMPGVVKIGRCLPREPGHFCTLFNSYDCLFGLGIPIVPDWRVGPPTRGQQQDGMLKLLQWLWGWTHLANQTIGKFPFDDLWQDLEADIEVESVLW